MSNLCQKILIDQTCPKHAELRIFGGCFALKVYKGDLEAKTEQQLIRRIKSKMKEFDKKFVEILLEGVKAKVKSIGDNGEIEYVIKIEYVKKFFNLKI